MELADICYLSGRKSCMVRGGLIATNRKDLYEAIRPWLPVYEGFYTYGGMSSKEIEAMAVGMREMTDLEVAGSSADAIKYFAGRLIEKGVPVVTPPGGLACHLDAMRFISASSADRISGRRAGARLHSSPRASAAWSAERSRWTATKRATMCLRISSLLRLAVPRRVFTMSHFQYATDRLKWLHEHRDMIGGLEFYEEPPILRFFGGKLEAQEQLGREAGGGFREGLRAGVLIVCSHPGDKNKNVARMGHPLICIQYKGHAWRHGLFFS